MSIWYFQLTPLILKNKEKSRIKENRSSKIGLEVPTNAGGSLLLRPQKWLWICFLSGNCMRSNGLFYITIFILISIGANPMWPLLHFSWLLQLHFINYPFAYIYLYAQITILFLFIQLGHRIPCSKFKLQQKYYFLEESRQFSTK